MNSYILFSSFILYIFASVLDLVCSLYVSVSISFIPQLLRLAVPSPQRSKVEQLAGFLVQSQRFPEVVGTNIPTSLTHSESVTTQAFGPYRETFPPSRDPPLSVAFSSFRVPELQSTDLTGKIG